jgi:hypothetical protein
MTHIHGLPSSNEDDDRNQRRIAGQRQGPVDLAESGELWAIPWPCVHEFLAIVTHPRIYDLPTPLTDAMEQVECWLEAPTLMPLGEDKNH